jgi:ribosomal protein L37E
MSAMIKCPRCGLPQQETSQCPYCGLPFEEIREPSRDSKGALRKRIVWRALISVGIMGSLLALYFYMTSQQDQSKLSTRDETASQPMHPVEIDDLRQKSKELSSYDGLLNDLSGGSTKGSIIATVIFSIIGLGYLSYGKKSKRLTMVICGVVLMSYSYFLNDMVYVILIGTGLSLVPFLLGTK